MLSSWIIEDGNCTDFTEGQIAEFALEFYLSDGKELSNSEREQSVKHLDEDIYEEVAKRVLATATRSICSCASFWTSLRNGEVPR